MSKEGNRDFGGMKEGSYTIATHFTPSVEARAVYVFLIGERSYNVTVGHDQNLGRVELTLDGALLCGRDFKFFDSGITLDFEVADIPGQVKITPYVFAFKYKLFVNSQEVPPCHTKKGGMVEDCDAMTIDTTTVGERRRRKSSVGWKSGGTSAGERVEGEGGEGKDGEREDSVEEEEKEQEEEKCELPTNHQRKFVSIAADNQLKVASAYDDYEPTLPRGVSYNKSSDTYSCRMMVRGKFLNLGEYGTVEEAARVYQDGVKRYSGK